MPEDGSIDHVVASLDVQRLVTRRWYRHKMLSSPQLAPIDGFLVEADGVSYGWWLLVMLKSEQGDAAYQIPVVLNNDLNAPGAVGAITIGTQAFALVDGGADPRMVNALFQTRDTERGAIKVDAAGAPSLPLSDLTQHEVGSTNTLIGAGDSALVKLYRCVDAGTQREALLLSGLTAQGVNSAPGVIATVEHRDAGTGRESILAIVLERIGDASDLWQEFTETLMSGERRHEAIVARLALAVRAMHEGLSALGARDWGDRDTVALKGRILAAVRDVAQGVEHSSLEEDFRSEVIEALHRVPEMLETCAVPPGGYVSAVHGDLHLGQILRQGDRCVIIDFEGEPLASVEERLAWHSPLKDVAGMIRSFDYAAGFAAQHAPQGRKTVFADWRDKMERTFLSEYGEFPVESGGHPRYPDALLSLYLIEKVLYEMKYELSSRPDWFGIPYSGLKRMVCDIRGDRLRSWKI